MADLKDKLSEHNVKAYMDIARDIFDQKQGVFTFIVKVDGKKIIDYVQMENIQYGRKEP